MLYLWFAFCRHNSVRKHFYDSLCIVNLKKKIEIIFFFAILSLE
jgi:hypothetical protein